MKQTIIGLYSPVMQSGKSTVAEYLCRHHSFQQISFAGPLKEMADKFFECLGVAENVRIAMLYGGLKEQRLPEIGVTPRHVMQTLGTEWGRQCIDTNLWVKTAMRRARLSTRNIVIDDLRFPNEFDAIRDAGGFCVKLVRPGLGEPSKTVGHASEGALDGRLFNFTLTNDSTIGALYSRVDAMMKALA